MCGKTPSHIFKHIENWSTYPNEIALLLLLRMILLLLYIYTEKKYTSHLVLEIIALYHECKHNVSYTVQKTAMNKHTFGYFLNTGFTEQVATVKYKQFTVSSGPQVGETSSKVERETHSCHQSLLMSTVFLEWAMLEIHKHTLHALPTGETT